MASMAYSFLLSFFFVANVYCEHTVSVGQLESRIDAIEQQCAAQNVQFKEENKKLTNQIDQLKTTVMKQDHNIVQLQDEFKDLRQFAVEKVKNIGQKGSKRFVMSEDETVAFHATLTGGAAIEHLHINQTVIFDNVMLNIGGAYHSQQGLFVSNAKGIYIFSVSIMGLYGAPDSTMVFIMKNGQEVAAAIADGRGGTHDQGSTTVVLQLLPGDEVWVSVQRHQDTSIWKDGLDSFMGCLITYT